MSSFKKFLREQCEIQDFDGNRIPAYLPVILNDINDEWGKARYYWFPSKDKTGIDTSNPDLDFTKLIEWNKEKMRNTKPEGYFIWLKYIPNLAVLDLDDIKGIREDSFKNGIRCTPEELKKVLEKVYNDFPWLKTKPYTLSRTKGLPHFYLKINNLPTNYTKDVDIFNNKDYDFDLLKYGKQSAELLDGEIFNYQDKYEIPKSYDDKKYDTKYFNDVFVEEWDNIKKDFNLEKMDLIKVEKEREEQKKKKESSVKRINTEKDIRKVFQEYHNYHMDKTGSSILCDYSEWLNFGFMIVNELGEDGWDIYDEFCSKCECHKSCYNQENNRKWFERAVKHQKDKSDDKAITLGSYRYKIKSYGIFINDLHEKFEVYACSDVAKLFYDLWCKDYVKYIQETKKIYIYDDKKCLWIEKEGENEIMINLRDKIGYIYDNVYIKLADECRELDDNEKIKEKQQVQRKILKMKQQLGDTTFMKKVYYALEPLIKDANFINVMNKNGDYLPIKNGLKLCLKTGSLYMREKTDYFTFEIDINYNPTCSTTNVDRYMNSLFISKNPEEDNTEFKNFMQVLFGYFLTGNVSHRKVYILYGNGKNGKTTLINLIKKMLGQFFKTTNDDIVIADRRGNKQKTSPELFDLFGTRLVVVNELEDGEKINTKKMKNIRGKDELCGRNLFEKKIKTFHTQAKLIILTNHKPKIDVDDVASTDSICFIPFNARFNTQLTEEEQKFLDYCNTPEFLNEFFSWCVKGAIKSYKEVNENMKEPVQLEESKQQFFNECDDFGNFVNENYEIDINLFDENLKLFTKGKENRLVKVNDFYNEYVNHLQKEVEELKYKMPKKKDIMKKIDERFGNCIEKNRYKFIYKLVYKQIDEEEKKEDNNDDNELDELLNN